MSRFIYLIAFLSVPFSMLAQKYDHQWVMGQKGNFNGDLSLLDFTGDTVKSSIYAYLDFELELPNGSSFICDENGNLLFLTNNCSAYTADLELVLGTDTLTPGKVYDDFCADSGRYPAAQSSLILPEMSSDSVFYIVHKDTEVNPQLQDVVSYNFYLSIIGRNEAGLFHLKEKKVLQDVNMTVNRLTACLHAEGESWWTFSIDYDSNRFRKFLIGGPDTVAGPFVQEVGETLINSDLGVGHAAFSPDGSLLGINSSEFSELVLYDFDNATGELSNYRAIPYPDTAGSAEGLVFSLDSRLAYVTAGRDLYQIDIEEETHEHIAHHTSISDWNWPVGMGYMYTGPDCRIYISPGTTSNYIHTIHNPNGKGQDCGYQPRSIRMPNNLSFDFPNLPQYRFDGACDSTIAFPLPPEDTVTVVATQSISEMGLQVFPNPFREHLTISFTERMPNQAKLILYDQMGRQVLDRPLPAGTNLFEINSLPSGVYLYEVWEKERRVSNGKVVKVE